ncbi:unnamed protein product [Vicia faba]|uniref:Reverse transcriptase domain-containing protein n=1 Tax=Vicia faba TaxID=3906 RepID=A0AAV1ALQ3_VICFA|nr:unnamed protein product [Vicia faba]
MGCNPHFNFHSKCEKLKIIDLSFANDLLLFTRGDNGSVDLALKVMKDFSSSTGLEVNLGKCKVFCGNVDPRVKQEILEASEFEEGVLPFKYLGIPISSKRISHVNCLGLIDRIVQRIRYWSSRLMNFAGRTQLIQSVIFVMSNF